MNYEVKVLRTADSGSGISVEAKVEGETVAHTFPKGLGFFDDSGEGKPRFVEKLEEKYEEKMKRKQKTSVQALSTEEAKIHGRYYENKKYSSSVSERFKQANNQDNVMDVELDEPEKIRQYLKENMAEGYLSDEEEASIDKFVDRYKEMMEGRQGFQQIVERIQTGRVQ